MSKLYEIRLELNHFPMPCATATTAMTDIATAEALDSDVVDWMEKVTDEQYQT